MLLRPEQKPIKSKRRSLRDVSVKLARLGYLTRYGKPYNPAAIKRMVETV